MLSKRRRPQRSQNFLHSRQLVSQLVWKTSFGKNDTVVEIGPGRGIITQELLQVARTVIAVEIDRWLCQSLSARLTNHPGLILFQGNFLSFPLPESGYKVFANTPFSIEGKVIRKLIDGKNPPQETHLVVRKDVGERWVGHRKESYFSLVRKPWFSMEITHWFRESDFIPQPKVDAVMIKISKRETPLLNHPEQESYVQFIEQGFGGGRRINTNLRSLLSIKQLKRLGGRYGFSYQARPTELNFKQWLQLFRAYLATQNSG